MTCWATHAERNRQADDADDALYAEEVERRALALMAPGQPCDPRTPENIAKATEAIFGDVTPALVTAHWYERAEQQVINEMSQHIKLRHTQNHEGI